MQVNFTTISYVTTYGNVIDISDLVLEINVFQSINDHYMQCEVALKDSVSLPLATPQDYTNKINGGFTGGELLIIQYTVDSPDNPTYSNMFTLYEASNRGKVKDTMEAYVLHGISLEVLESYPRKISRSFGGDNGNTVSNMLKNIVDEYVYSSNVKDLYERYRNSFKFSQNKQLVISETQGLQKFIIPNLSVDDTIEFLCNEAQSSGETSRFYFWERQEGFYFYNLEDLVSAEPVMDYIYSEFNVSNDLGQKRVIAYEISKETNFLEKARDGMYKSKTIALDVLKKKKYETIFDYEEIKSKDKFKKMQPFYHGGKVDSDDVNVTLITTRRGHDCQCQIFKTENHLPKRVDGLIANRRSYMKHIFNSHMNVIVPGTTLINAGDCVNFNFAYKSLSDQAEASIDTELSGKYLVTKLMNKFKVDIPNSTMTTHMECVKDTQVVDDNVMTSQGKQLYDQIREFF